MLVGLASTLAGAVVLLVRGWPWGAGALVGGLLWMQWRSGKVLAGLDSELVERAREMVEEGRLPDEDDG